MQGGRIHFLAQLVKRYPMRGIVGSPASNIMEGRIAQFNRQENVCIDTSRCYKYRSTSIGAKVKQSRKTIQQAEKQYKTQVKQREHRSTRNPVSERNIPSEIHLPYHAARAVHPRKQHGSPEKPQSQSSKARPPHIDASFRRNGPSCGG